MVKTLYYLFKEIRPRQWVKNLVIFAAIFFTGKLFDPKLLPITILAVAAFCAASSSLYLLNDLVDREKDRLHPFKKNRPLAAGKISPKLAIIILISLAFAAFLLATKVSFAFMLVLVIFYVLQIAYNLFLKNIVLLDILTIAAGFILRVFAGEVATGYHIDIWLFLTIISIALFLAIGKRRSELTLLAGWQGTIAAKTRATLSRYSEKMLDVYLSMFASSTWITYAFYTFLRRPPVFRQRFENIFEQYDLDILQERKWMMLTIPLVIYGLMRYLELIYEKNEGESPEKILFSDRPLMLIIILWAGSLMTIIYLIGK